MSAAISKEKLFQTPKLLAAKVSPDGKCIAEIGANDAGIPNVFITSKDCLETKRVQISSFDSPDLIQFFWSADSKKILLLKDENGTGQLNLHGIDILSKSHTVYTEPFSNVQAKLIQISSKKNQAVIGLNHRNPHFHDPYLLDLDSGKFTHLFENDQYAQFLFSDDLDLILKVTINPDGSWTVQTKDDELFLQLSPEEAFHTEFLAYDTKKRAVYMLDNRFSDTNQLILKPLSKSLKEQVLGAPFDSDVDDVLLIGTEPKAYASYYTQKKWHILDPSFKKEIDFLEAQLGSNFSVVSQSQNGAVWIISTCIPDKGGAFWIYEREKEQLIALHSSKEEEFAKMYELIVEARDGEKLVCYYTLPKDLDRGGSVESPIPLIVVPHGGPFKARDRFEFNPFHQWLASCGYAVLSVNFRLSSGFGKAFVNAGNGQWGGKAHLDVIDAVEACISKGLTEKGKLAVVGGSYGGYESLAALTFTPDYFTCCVAICGPSNLKTVLDNVPQYWEFTSKPLSDRMMFFTKHAFITSMGGDPSDEEGTKYLERCSPLNHLEEIKAPLMLIHGQNDHVVVENESRQIYESMKKNQKRVTYILFPDEGHRPAKFANKMLYLNHAERFLSQYLGGEYRPVKEDIVMQSNAVIYD